MSIARQRIDIEEMFFNDFPLLEPTVEITGENADFTPTNEVEWVRLSLTVSDIIYPCLNNEKKQTDGIFSVQVFTPVSIGSSRASEISDAVVDVLRNGILNAIAFLEFSITPAGQDSGWYINIVRANYRAQD